MMLANRSGMPLALSFDMKSQSEIRVCKCGAKAVFKSGKFNSFSFLPDRNKLFCEISRGGKGSSGTQKHKWEKSQES